MWTREDCRKFEALGVLPARWELVQGEIVSKMGNNWRHSATALRITVWMTSNFHEAHLLPTCSIDVAPEDNPTSEPEPDIAVLNRPSSELRNNPVPSDIAMLIEVSDKTIDFDLGPKARLYARAGIPEYWVIDLNRRVFHQHRQPSAEGYGSIRVVAANESLSPLAQPEATLTPAEIFD